LFCDVGYICANVLARLKDLLDLDEDMSEKEKKAFEKRLELFLFSKDVTFQPSSLLFTYLSNSTSKITTPPQLGGKIERSDRQV